NAVIGNVHRLGLSGRAPTSRTATARPRPRISAPRRPAKPRFASVGNVALRSSFQLEAEPYVSAYEEIDIPVAERKSLLDLTDMSCRWPINDPQHADFHFCNRSKVTGLPYCEHHSRRAFQPAQPRRRERVEIPIVAAPRQPAAVPPAQVEPVQQDQESIDA
ncbi:unnamed protein product, partial [Phaeothamnion confervicola]